MPPPTWIRTKPFNVHTGLTTKVTSTVNRILMASNKLHQSVIMATIRTWSLRTSRTQSMIKTVRIDAMLAWDWYQRVCRSRCSPSMVRRMMVLRWCSTFSSSARRRYPRWDLLYTPCSPCRPRVSVAPFRWKKQKQTTNTWNTLFTAWNSSEPGVQNSNQ